MGPGPRRLDAVHSYDLTLASSILLSSRTVRRGVRTWWVPHDLIISWALVLPSPGPGLLARSRVTRKTFACSRRCPGSAALGGTGAGLWVRPACAASAVLLAPGVWLQRLRGGKRNHQKRRTGRVWRGSRCPGVWGAGEGSGMVSGHPELGAALQPLSLYAENNTSLGSGNCGTGREVLECG